MSVMGSSAEVAPVATGSVAAVEIQHPLPQKLAYSDATKIGQSAAAALQEVGGPAEADWVNAATGSSGTLTDMKQDGEAEGPSGACRLFNTIVTSFSGVHRYSGRICAGDSGKPVVQISDAASVGDV